MSTQSAVKVLVTESEMRVISPYNAAFVAAAKQLGGKFDSASKAWTFDAALEGNVREKLVAVYGTDGTPAPTLTICIELDKANPGGSDYTIGPITVLKKWGRDEAPRLGAGCAIIAGKLKSSGGSVKYPDITWKPGTIVRVANVPQAIAEKLIAAGEAFPEEPLSPPDPAALTPAEAQIVSLLRQLDAARRDLVIAHATRDDRTPEEIVNSLFVVAAE